MKTVAIFMVMAILFNAMGPTLTYAAKQSQGVEQATKESQGKTVTVMSGRQIDSSKIAIGWYAHIVYTSEEGTKRTATGQIMEKGTDYILIRVEDKVLKSWKTIAYRDMDTLVIAQHTRDIEEWRNVRPVQRHGEQSMQQLYWIITGFFGGAIGWVIGARIGGAGCEQGEIFCDGVTEGGIIGALIGSATSIVVARLVILRDQKPHGPFGVAMKGSLMGLGAGTVMTMAVNRKLWPSMLIGPVVGATILSRRSHDTLDPRRFSVGFAPDRDGNLSALATFRF